MTTLEQVLRSTTGLRAAALADANGLVLETSGEVEAESLCALVAMSKPVLERAADLLGLGALSDWSFTYHTGALFVCTKADGSFVTVQGAATRNPEITLSKLVQTAGEPR